MTVSGPRRNNAPLRPRKPATSVPDVLFAVGTALLAMAVAFFVASFFDDSLSNGDAGTVLARAFAATLGISALFIFLLGLLLLRDDRKQLDHYRTPLLLGVVIGAIEAWLFLKAVPALFLLGPVLLLIFAFRPIRRAVASMFRPQRTARR